MKRIVPKCDTEPLLTLITTKWNLHIVKTLELNPNLGFNKLKDELKPISAKTLSSRLKTLEQLTLVSKQVLSEKPPSVCYALTEKGKELVTQLYSMEDWMKTL